MNRFTTRAASLILAVVFLFSAAAISFSTLFHGVTVYAADSVDLKITKVVGNITGLPEGDRDLTKVSTQPNTSIKTLTIGITNSNDNFDPLDAEFTFHADTFAKDNNFDFKIVKDGSTTGTTGSYTITLTNVIYKEGTYIEIALTPKTGGGAAATASHPIKTPGDADSYSIIGSYFTNSAGDLPSKITGGTTGDLVVSVRDNGINYDKFNELAEKYAGGDKTAIGVKINKDAFEPSANGLRFENIDASGTSGVSYDIIFENLRYTGRDNRLRLTLSYGTGYTVRSLVYTVDNCVITPESSHGSNNNRDDDDSSSSRPDIAPPTPTMIVSSFDYGGQTVTAAGNFTLKMVVTNTSKKLPIDNIVIKVTVPEAFTMNGSSNSFYIEKMTKDSSQELTLNLSVKPNAEPISHPIKLAFSFESVIDEVRKPLTADQEISIPVGQLDRFSLNSVEVPSEIYVGEDSSFEVTFVNKGKTPVYNVSAEITGNLAQPGQRQFIGNLESGKEDSADFLLGALEPGVITGEVVITYEDANMHVTELKTPFTANAIQMDMGGKPEMDMTETNAVPEVLPWYITVWNAVPVWGWIGGGVALVVFVAFAVKLIRSHRQKKREEQDEDF